MTDKTLTSFYDTDHRCIGPHNACACGMSREVKVRYNDFYGDGSIKQSVMEAHTTGQSLAMCLWGWLEGGREVSITRATGEFVPVRDFSALILLRDGDTIINHPGGRYVAFR